jgi:hypothetical protein
METKIDKANDFIRINHEKIKAPLFISSFVIFIAYFLFWGIGDDGYFNGIFTLISIISDHSDFIGFNGEISFSFYFLLFSLMLIPISSGYIMYSSWYGGGKHVQIAKVVLLISFLPFILVAVFKPISRFGLFISIISIAYLFFPIIGNRVIAKIREFIKNKQPK